MPSRRRRSKRRSAGWSLWEISQLETGFDFVGKAFGEGESFDEPACRAAWEQCRHDLLGQWARERPGVMPWAYWKFEVGMDVVPLGDHWQADALASLGAG